MFVQIIIEIIIIIEISPDSKIDVNIELHTYGRFWELCLMSRNYDANALKQLFVRNYKYGALTMKLNETVRCDGSVADFRDEVLAGKPNFDFSI